MMRHFLSVKAEHPNAIVFYRMGDFYEMFLEDAERAAPLLGIALTTRDRGKQDPVSMCGVPVHGADRYVKRLAELGHRVAICEQVEDARAAAGTAARRRGRARGSRRIDRRPARDDQRENGRRRRNPRIDDRGAPAR
jgi:DNA mismatch repair protein MutS